MLSYVEQNSPIYSGKVVCSAVGVRGAGVMKVTEVREVMRS